ncbi:OmpA family protein [Pedobacter faecalis]|uniref:OmpA family protein n=1 Tax=Pedobacter faecalis TaxID=3041495 RepID=UPI00254E22C0|nr:OmpA family protein [Pedobacter sp. ELA7]
MNRWLFGLCFFLFPCISHAQVTSNKKAQTAFDKAQRYLKDEAYNPAVENLKSALKEDPEFAYAWLQLGDILRKQKRYADAKAAFVKYLLIAKVVDPRAYFGLSEACLLTGDYKYGLENIRLFLDRYRGTDPDFKRRANKYLADFEFAVNAVTTPLPYSPENLGPEVNSEFRDYFPAMTADGTQLIFSRNVHNNEDFFISRKKDGAWTAPVPLSDRINTSGFNEGAQSISADGRYLFFTGCNRPDGLGRCDIYLSKKEGDAWAAPFNLGAPVNTIYWESQPAVSPDGGTLYFVSNRPGGQGGYDIWKSTLKADGYWAEPVNLGPEINTPYDEHTPFMHADGRTLYFSSDGWPGFGNKDIFVSRMDATGRWTKPENMGYPLNTFNEESGLVVMADGTEGLYSAELDRGYGDMDIYSFKIPAEKKPGPVTYVKGIVKDKESGKFVQAEVTVARLSDNVLLFNDYTSDTDGEFTAVMPLGNDYAFEAAAEGYLFFSAHYALKEARAGKPFNVEILMERLKVGQELVMKNIFFETNKSELLPASLTELNTLISFLKDNPGLQVEVQGHTDNVGKPEDNLKLSLARAKSVHNHLVDSGIQASRLSFKGFGETAPIAGNSTEKDRSLNRRTSFKITAM